MGLFSGFSDLMEGGSEQYYDSIRTPDPEAMKIKLEEYVQQGLITPEEAQVALQDPSAMEAIVSDPSLKEAQMSALGGLQDVAESGGLDANAKARMNDIAKSEGIRERGAREAILGNAAQKGTSGSGLEFLSQLKNQQEGADRVSDRDTQVAADAESRALDALINSGNLAGNIRGQDFSEASKIAQAKDAINAFNTSNRNQTNMWNVGNRNDAQRMNLNSGQSIANANVDNRNKAQIQNKALPQQTFENKLTLARAKSGANETDAERRRRGVGDIEGAMGSMVGAFV
ncbi:MAG: hypothetical protein IPI28_18910 [Candidatus Omnitrophica bacterium]|nr:hypothetical protein [Candidatus Omnitrophota bacterium]